MKQDYNGSVPHNDDLGRVEREIMEQTTDSDERHDYVHYRILTKSGDIRYVEDFGHLVHDKAGEAFYYVFIVDIEEAEYRKLNLDEWESRVGYPDNYTSLDNGYDLLKSSVLVFSI